MIACWKEERKFYNILEKLSKTQKQPSTPPPPPLALKQQKIQKSLGAVLEGTLGYIYTKNLVNWTFFLEKHILSGEVFSPKFLPCWQKNGCFLPKNRAIFCKNLQNFGNQ